MLFACLKAKLLNKIKILIIFYYFHLGHIQENLEDELVKEALKTVRMANHTNCISACRSLGDPFLWLLTFVTKRAFGKSLKK